MLPLGPVLYCFQLGEFVRNWRAVRRPDWGNGLKLIIIGGFLGAGKTTLILRLARELPVRGSGKLAIIVNDFGKVGIDGKVLGGQGLEVKELYSGCICCQLGLDLLSTLHSLEKEHHPDLVILEPSGIAEPGNIIKILPYYEGTPLEKVKSIILVDSCELPLLLDALTPLISGQIAAADVVALNKLDEASPEEIQEAEKAVRSIHPDVNLIALSAVTGHNVADLYDEILG